MWEIEVVIALDGRRVHRLTTSSSEHIVNVGGRTIAAHSPLGARRVRTDLFCVSCGYNLKGIDEDRNCPECGTAVRDTVWYVVDPSRSRFAPLVRPRTTCLGMMGTSGAALLAAVVIWMPEIGRITEALTGTGVGMRANWADEIALAAPGLMLIAWAFAGFLKAPTSENVSGKYAAGLRWARSGLMLWTLVTAGAILSARLRGHDMPALLVPLTEGSLDPWRICFRLAMDAAAVVAIRGFVPVVGFLSLRSVSHRAGQINRQGLRALLYALLVVILGDGLQAASLLAAEYAAGPKLDMLGLSGMAFIVVGTFMLTLAIFNEFMDAVRIRRAILRPRRNETEILGEPRGAS